MPDEILINGYLSDKDDFNDRPVPYDFVRKLDRRGSCFANTYRESGSFLLFLQRERRGWALYADALAPVNEQLHGKDDPWAYWVKGFLAASKARH